ncbi:MAG: hypothetical protein QOF61_1883 [Acidobacteriota bacterium]|nr:hypothetical protein [Acidobacteriota bacterium]
MRSVYRRRPLLTIVILGAALHLTCTTAIFITGRFALMPSQFDAYGIGVFAHDGHLLQPEVEALAETLKGEGLTAWARRPSTLHLKLYSVFIAVFGFWSGFNILTIEPLNLLYYLAILILVFRLSQEMFDRRAALLAVVVTGLWPSFLLHTTQLLKDPLLINAVLVLLFILAKLLTTKYTWRQGVVAGVVASVAVLVIWIVRTSMWDAARVMVLFGLVLLIARQVRERRALPYNLVSMALLIMTIIIIPQHKTAFTSLQTMPDRAALPLEQEVEGLSLEERIKLRRDMFNGTDDDGQVSGSTIDTDRQFQSRADMVSYLPRAVVIGFLAPFPNMWFAKGTKVDSSGRLLSGFEMLLTYVIELLAVFGVWHRRHHLTTWLLFFTFAAGAVGLGLVVRNIGTLYRLRYPFWVPLVILGAGGAAHLSSSFFAKKRIGGGEQVASVRGEMNA